MPIVGWITFVPSGSTVAAIEAEQVRTTVKQVGDWQLAHPDTQYNVLHWVVAPLLARLIETSLVTGDPKYLAAVIWAGTPEGWRVWPNNYHPDGMAVGYAHLFDGFESRRERLDQRSISDRSRSIKAVQVCKIPGG